MIDGLEVVKICAHWKSVGAQKSAGAQVHTIFGNMAHWRPNKENTLIILQFCGTAVDYVAAIEKYQPGFFLLGVV